MQTHNPARAALSRAVNAAIAAGAPVYVNVPLDYDAMVKSAADRLESLFRRGQTDVDVWAIPSTLEWDGRLHVGAEYPDESRACLVRPSGNGASAYHRWQDVPYSALREIMGRACALQPILPLDRA